MRSAVLLLSLGAGCAAPERAPVARAVGLEVRDWPPGGKDAREVRLAGLDLGVRQEPDLCWAACLEVAHGAYGIDVDQRELAEHVVGPEAEGAKRTASSWQLFFADARRYRTQAGREVEVRLVVHPELVVAKKRKKDLVGMYLHKAIAPRLKRREPVLLGLETAAGGPDEHVWLVVGARLGFSAEELEARGTSAYRVREVELFDPSDGGLEWRDFDDVEEGALMVMALDARVVD